MSKYIELSKRYIGYYKKALFPPYTKKNLPAIGMTGLLVVSLFVITVVLNKQSNTISNAAAINSIEPEDGTVAGNVQTLTSASASAGKYVVFGNPRTSLCTGPTITVAGKTNTAYTNNSPADSTTFQLGDWFSNAVTGTGSAKAFDVGTGNAPKDVCVLGGVIYGSIDPNLPWQFVHDSISGFGYRTATSGLAVVDGVRVHNVEDGWKPRECATSGATCTTFTNLGSMKIQNAYMTAIRDDSIEDDDFMPGDIQDSLFDGVWTFLSEQYQSGGNTSIGANEDPNIRITRDYVRLYTTNTPELGPGKWFKFQGNVPHHTLIITDSVFAVDKQPRLGWSSLAIPAGTQWVGTNYILWLGTPGTYGGPKPAGVIFLEGQPAIDKWNQVRNDWLTAHGYAPVSPTDFNPYDNPVVAPN